MSGQYKNISSKNQTLRACLLGMKVDRPHILIALSMGGEYGGKKLF
jgi:hypothetical protein